MDWLLGRRYLTLFLALTFLMVTYPVFNELSFGRILFHILFTVVFFAGLLTIFPDRHYWAPALVLGFPTLVAIWTSYLLPDLPPLPVAFALHSFTALFFAILITGILITIYKKSII